jgi:glycosyltransferase involved in cell wall biosynthesis
MKISAIIAVYNGADRLREAIASIQAQDFAPSEIIVVDDGSTDATPDVIRSYGTAVRAFRKEHGGLSAAHNFALRQATGEAIAFLDHDDLWTPHCLSSLMGLLQSDPAIDIASGKVEMRYERSVPPSPEMQRCLVETNRPFMMHSLLIRREMFDRIGGFDERLTHAMDVDWYMRARDHGARFGLVDRVTMIYRMHETNMTRDLYATTQGILSAFKTSLDRRRMAR